MVMPSLKIDAVSLNPNILFPKEKMPKKSTEPNKAARRICYANSTSALGRRAQLPPER